MKDINIVIKGDKRALIHALTALQNARIDVVSIKVGNGAVKAKKQADRPYKLAEEYDGNYKDY